jgi:hypothetical protein
MVHDLILLHQPYTIIYSGPLSWSSTLKLLSHERDSYTFIPQNSGLHCITYGTETLYLEAVTDLITITLLLLYTNVITGYQYQGIIYTTEGQVASELTYDQTIPIKIKKPIGPLEFYLQDDDIIYGPPKLKSEPHFLGTIIIDL